MILFVETAWSDGANRSGLKIEKAIYLSNYNTPKRRQCEINDIVVWSWHFWISDYNPYVTKILNMRWQIQMYSLLACDRKIYPDTLSPLSALIKSLQGIFDFCIYILFFTL